MFTSIAGVFKCFAADRARVRSGVCVDQNMLLQVFCRATGFATVRTDQLASPNLRILQLLSRTPDIKQ